MEFYNTIANFFKGKTINDPMFGELRLNRISSDHYWYGKVRFAPIEDEITIYISELEDRVSKEYRQFYIELEDRYSGLVEPVVDCLHKAYNESNGNLSRQDVWKLFRLTAVSFPTIKEIGKQFFQWDLYYSYDLNKPAFNVEMKNWRPEDCYSGE